MTVVATREVVGRVIRTHQVDPTPDSRGRVMVCACGWWQPGRTYAQHLLDVFDAEGLQLTRKDTP